MQEKIDLIKTLDDETGVEESLETRMRVIGNKSYTAKLSITDGQEKEEIITEMDNDELENFKKEWDEKDGPSSWALSRAFGNWSLTFKLFETFACIENYPNYPDLVETEMVRVLKEVKDLTKTINDEIRVEKSHESHSRVFGNGNYTLTAKLCIHN